MSISEILISIPIIIGMLWFLLKIKDTSKYPNHNGLLT